MNDQDRKQVATECLEYAKQHKCSIARAIVEWEGDNLDGVSGPDGVRSLYPIERTEITEHFHAMGMDLDKVRCIELDETNTRIPRLTL